MTEPDDAPLDRTGEAVTKADLFDTAQWLDRRIGVVRDELSDMAAGSGDVTSRIMSDLAGIRAEQMHLARRLDMLGAELRMDIRKELRNADWEATVPATRSGAGRGALVLMSLLIATFLLAILTFLPALLPALGLDDRMLDWLPGQWP